MTAPAVVATVATYKVLDAAYRAAIAGVAAEVIRAMLAQWNSVSPDNLTQTSAQWLAASVRLIVAGQARAQEYANAYTLRVRELAVPGAPSWTPPAAREANVEQLFKSLLHQGIRTTGQEIGRLEATTRADREREVEELRDTFQRDQDAAAIEEARKRQLMQDGIKRAAAAAIRHITTAGHDQIYDNVQSDPVARGWMRTTRAGCCYFCAMLASRGPVYEEESFAESNARFSGPGNQKVHDTCVPAGTLVAGPVVEVGFRRRYEGEAIHFRTASGNELTITPNHPVLTDQGWIPAGFLEEGSNVISRPTGEWALLGVPDEYQSPARIEDRLSALAMEGGTFSVPPSAEQFHGDWFDSEVDIVASDRLLADWVESQVAQVTVELSFPSGGAPGPAVSLAGLCPQHHFLLAGDPSPGRAMRGSHLLGALLGAQGGPPGGRGFPPVAGDNPLADQALLDDTTVDSEVFRELLDRLAGKVSLNEARDIEVDLPLPLTRFDPPSPKFGEHDLVAYADLGARLLRRLAGEVELDRVVELRRVSLPSSHVYNLQTAEGWYSAGGIIVSNCGCGMRPVYTDDDPVPERTDKFEKLWISSTEGRSGPEAVKAFRRAYDEMLAAERETK